MLLTKVKGVAAVVLALAAVGAGGGALSYRAAAGPAQSGPTARLAARTADTESRQIAALKQENAALRAEIEVMRRQLEADRAKMKSAVDQALAQAQLALEQENKAKRIAEFHGQALNEKAPPAKVNPARGDGQREDGRLRDLAERYRVEAQRMQQELKARQAALEQALARERINAEQARAQAVQAQKQFEDAQTQVAEYTAKLRAGQQDSTRAAGAQKARDEAELLKAQLAIKKAELDAAKASAEGAVTHSQQLDALRRSGAVQESLVLKAQTDAKVAMAQIRVKQAEVQAAEVALTQALRRMEVLGGGASKAPAGQGREARLKELEGKLNALRKELQSLRQGSSKQ